MLGGESVGLMPLGQFPGIGAPAGRSSWVTLLGTTAGIIGKLSIGLLMILWFLVAAFVA